MRRRRRILFVLPVVLLGALLLAAWLVPSQLDWARYRGTIAQVATTRLGLPVTIDGPIALRLLPEPVLTAGKVSVGNPATDGVLIRVQALRLRLGLLPLLTGRIDARALVLHRPDLHIPWPDRHGVLHAGPPVWRAAFDARVEDGRLSIGQFAVTGINGTLSRQESKTQTAAATADIAGQHWRVMAQLTDAGPDSASHIRLRLRGEGKVASTTARFTGQLAASGALDGRVTVAGPNLSLLLPAPALRFQAQGRLTVADGLAEMDQATVRLDGLPVDAAVSLLVLPRPQLDIALSANRLNLDPWLPLLLRQPRRQRALPVGVDVSAKAATLSGATLRHLRATFSLTPGTVRVERIAAEVPGNAMLRVAGRITRSGDGPVFNGTGRLQAPVLRTTLRWLLPHAADDLKALPADVARQAELSGKLLLRPDHVAISEMQGQFDGNALRGSVSWKRGKPPAVAADLRLARMRLGPWLAQGDAGTGLRQLVLHRLNTDLRLQVEHASLHGTGIDGLTLDATTLDGSVSLRRLRAQVRGAQLSASGALSSKGVVSNGHLLLTTDNALKLANLLPAAWRATPALWFGPARLEIDAAGPRNAVAGKIRLHLGDLRLQLQPTVNLAAGTAAGSITAQDPNAQRLISDLALPDRLGLNGVPDWLGEGSMSLVAQLGVGPRWHVSLKHGQLVAGQLRTNLDLTLDANGGQPVVTGTLAAESLPLPIPSRGPLPVRLLKGWQARLQVTAGRVLGGDATLLRQATATVTVQHDALSVDKIGGKLSSGTLAASASLDAAQQPPALSVQAKLTGAAIDGPALALPIDVTSGKANLSLSLRAAGYSTRALTASLSGTMQGSVQDGTLSGFDLAGLRDQLQQPGDDPSGASLRKLLAGGQTPFRTLTLRGKVAHGILSLDQAKLTGTAGTAEATGTVALPDSTADLRVVLHPAIPNGPGIPVLVNGALGAPDRTPELAGVARWRSGQGH